MYHADVKTQAVSWLNMSPITSTQVVRSNETQRLDAAISLLYPPTVHVQHSRSLLGHVHSLHLLTLSNEARLILKGSPVSRTPLLRHERLLLETEARFLTLLGHTANPCIPQLYYYNPSTRHAGSAYLIRQYIKGTPLAEMENRIPAQQRNCIDHHLGFLASTIGQNAAPAFGSLQQVAARAGRSSWREAFCALFESVLRDAEDVFVNLPYAQIRDELSRLGPVLDEASLPRLVVVEFGRPSHVLLNERSKQVVGVVDFSSALWGDVLMAEIFEGASPAVLEGAGFPLERTAGEELRLLMYVLCLILSLLFLKSLLIYFLCLGILATDRYAASRKNIIEIRTRRESLMHDDG